MSFYVYVRRDPDGTVRYVGQTMNPAARGRDHKYNESPKVREWMLALQPFRPKLEVVCIVQDKQEALRLEGKYVQVLLRRGVPLLNSIERTAQHCDNISRALLERFATRPGNFKGRTHSPETIKRMSESAYKRSR